MARWRLAAPHYLNVPGSEWEYKETDRTTGRPKRTLFPVPQLLNPEVPQDWNYVYGKDSFGQPDTGEIIVSNIGDSNFPKDILFTSDPTPDMVPLDDDAKAISTRISSKYKHPIESLSGTYADEMLKDLGNQMDAVRAKAAEPMQGMTELLTAMSAMMQQNQDMMKALMETKAVEPKAARRA